MSRLQEIHELTRVRVLSFLREPEAIFWVFIFPLVLAAVLGFAFRSSDVKPSRVAVVEGQGMEAVVAALGHDDHIEIERYADSELARAALRKAAVDALVEPGGAGAGADADADAGSPRLSFDPVRPEAATARLRVQRMLMLDVPGNQDASVSLEPVTETGSRYVDYLFPGLLGMNLMGTGLWGIGFAIADVRRRKFLKRMLVTPMRRSSFLLSFIFSRLVFLVLEMTVLVSFGHWVLGVPFRGGILAFVVMAFLGAFTFAGLGILVASRVRTIEGVSGIMNLVMMPMWLLSGVFFSYERFPEFLHPVLRLLPLTALNDGLRAVMLDGESLLLHGHELIVVVAWGVLTFGVALKIFRWE